MKTNVNTAAFVSSFTLPCTKPATPSSGNGTRSTTFLVRYTMIPHSQMCAMHSAARRRVVFSAATAGLNGPIARSSDTPIANAKKK